MGVFIAQLALEMSRQGGWINLLALSRGGLRFFLVWQPLTYMFLHGGFWHLAFNMYSLALMGPPVEYRLGRGHFLAAYFLSGVLGGLGFVLLEPYGVCIGASAGVMGILGAFAALYPTTPVTLIFLPFFSLPAWGMVLLFGFFELTMLLKFPGSRIAHSAHLAGGLAGYFYVRGLLRGGPRRRSAGGGWADLRRRWAERNRRAPDAAAVDRLLDKVAREGLHRLTPAEREQLEKASRR